MDRKPMDPLAPKIDAAFFGITDVGRKRKQNEDNFLIADLQAQHRGLAQVEEHRRLGGRGMLFAVCDGMGGAAAGEVASQMAVDTLFKSLIDLEPGMDPQVFASLIDRAIIQANREIFELAQQDKSKKGMGTTVSAAAVYGNMAFLAQVGDSRAYLIREGKLIRVTKDQSLVERLIEEGQLTEEQAKNFVGKNVILQALGPTPQVLVDLKFIKLRENDMILLCTDGLHGEISEEQLFQIVTSPWSLPDMGRALIQAANDNGGPDNITAILVRLNGEDLKPPKPGEEAIPQSLKYAREFTDALGLRLEKELGLIHRVNKYFFATPMIILYVLVFLCGLGYLGYRMRGSRTATPPSVSKKVQLGALVVLSDVQDAEVSIDGNVIGTLQAGGTKVDLPVGNYKVSLRSGDWSSDIRSIKIGKTRTTLLEIFQNPAKKPKQRRDSTAAQQEWLPGRDPAE